MNEFIGCQSRLPGHTWEDYAGSDWKPQFGTGWEWQCTKCGSIRRYIIDVNGYVIQRSYWHPKGYSYTKDERPSNEDLRLMALKERRRRQRAIKKSNVTPMRRKA